MAGSEADWSTNSNNAVHISLVHPAEGGSKTLHNFNPKMTYSIFGDEETIFGYHGLNINIRYNACDMRPNLQIHYSKMFKAVGETEPTDLKAVLEQYLPKSFEKTSVFHNAISEPSYAGWKPPGQLWKTIEEGGEIYEIYQGNLSDLAVQQMLKRIQIFVPFFIEGGTCIDLGEPEWSLERWTVFFHFQKKPQVADSNVSPYIFMSYSTVYRYFYFRGVAPPPPSSMEKQHTEKKSTLDFELPLPEIKFTSLPCRSRISQFVILPPFQGNGNGARFYNAIFDYYLQQPQTVEITVEDPNEAFDDLRDLNDLARLRKDPDFTALRIRTSVKSNAKGYVPRDIIDVDTLDKLRTKYKIAPRQFARVVEMQLLSQIPTSVRQSLLLGKPKTALPDLKLREHEYHLWQLWVKIRLYRHNKDTLMQLDRAERIDKLEQALGGVEADYARLLRKFERKLDGGGDGATSGGSKRPSPPDDDEMEEAEPSVKKVKLSA